MKEKLMLCLKKADLPVFEKEYVLEVVKYIDDCMNKLESQDVTFESVIGTMLELAQTINNCNTGISIIDNIVNLRQQDAYEKIGHLGESAQQFVGNKDYRTGEYGYILNYIAIISNYGGLYKYVCENYKIEIEKVESKDKKTL